MIAGETKKAVFLVEVEDLISSLLVKQKDGTMGP